MQTDTSTSVGKTDETFHSETFPVVPYEHVYGGAVDNEFYRKNQFFHDKIVLIGNATTVGKDHFNTPAGMMWGVEVHAHAIATLLQNKFVRAVPHWVNFAILCLLAALVCPLAALWRLPWSTCAAVGSLVGYFVFNVWLFVDHGVWLHLVAPSAAMVMTTMGVLLERGLTEERGKKRAYGLLRRYVGPQVAEHIIANPDAYILEVVLKGVKWSHDQATKLPQRFVGPRVADP